MTQRLISARGQKSFGSFLQKRTVFSWSPAACVIILNAAATYLALLSAWLLAISARRAASLQGAIAAIEVELSADPAVRRVQEQALANLRRRIAAAVGRDRRYTRRGIALLLLSLGRFSGAPGVHLDTDAAFRQAGTARH